MLGSAGPENFIRDFANAPFAGTWFPIAIVNANAGTDLDPGVADVGSSFSNTFPFYFGTDALPPAGTFDLVTVALHEFGHGTGFVGSGRIAGGIGSFGRGTTFPFVYDRFVRNAAGQALIAAVPNNSAAFAAAITGGVGSLFFNTPASTLLGISAPATVYAPNPFEGGSSYSHLDETIYPAGDPNSLMSPAVGFAEANHQPGAITLAMYSDMGWPGGAPPPPPPPGGLPSMVSNFDCSASSAPP